MTTYMRNPFTLEAVQWNGNFFEFIDAWRAHSVDITNDDRIVHTHKSQALFVLSAGKEQWARVGDYVARRALGNYSFGFVVYGRHAFETQFQAAPAEALGAAHG